LDVVVELAATPNEEVPQVVDKAQEPPKLPPSLLPGRVKGDNEMSQTDVEAAQAEMALESQNQMSRTGHNPARTLTNVAAALLQEPRSNLSIDWAELMLLAKDDDRSNTRIDTVFRDSGLVFDDARSSSAPPKMLKPKEGYRPNQIRTLSVDSPAAFRNLVINRRAQCFEEPALSVAYLACRVSIIMLWCFVLIEQFSLNPLRLEWERPELQRQEDQIMEAFVLYASTRYLTWGSVSAALVHVIEWHRSVVGIVAPSFSNTGYIMRKLKKLMAALLFLSHPPVSRSWRLR
jgi:hypothetical protein